MENRSLAKRWLSFFAASMSILSIVHFFKHRPISREDLIDVLAITVGVTIAVAFPVGDKTLGRLGFRLGQKLKDYRRRNAES